VLLSLKHYFKPLYDKLLATLVAESEAEAHAENGDQEKAHVVTDACNFGDGEVEMLHSMLVPSIHDDNIRYNGPLPSNHHEEVLRRRTSYTLNDKKFMLINQIHHGGNATVSPDKWGITFKQFVSSFIEMCQDDDIHKKWKQLENVENK
jgi:hypothetical protein